MTGMLSGSSVARSCSIATASFTTSVRLARPRASTVSWIWSRETSARRKFTMRDDIPTTYPPRSDGVKCGRALTNGYS